jgi:hypothetical protein
MSGIHLVIEARPTFEVPVRRPLPKRALDSEQEALTNLIATGWLVRRFAPEGAKTEQGMKEKK